MTILPENNTIQKNGKLADKNMGWRGKRKNYRWPGTYHITISILERKLQLLGHIVGDTTKPDGDPQAPRVILSDLGKMVEHELHVSIHTHYPMVEVQDYVIMPDHLHFIVVVHKDIISGNGRETHLGQVIAGFKKGCNRRFWEITAQKAKDEQGKPAPASITEQAQCPLSANQGTSPLSAVYPQSFKVPSTGSTGRAPLFSYGYVDVMPLKEGQLERQREYIRNNPRYRLMRMNNPKCLTPQRGTINTALTLPALKGYLQRECGPHCFDDEIWESICQRILTNGKYVICDSYGDTQLLKCKLLPIVCHRKDARTFERQKSQSLSLAASGSVLVSARIAKGEQDIMQSATDQGLPVIAIEDNGFPAIYHPSESRMDLCTEGRLLIVTPWKYLYRRVNDNISVAECKTMNCIVQAICRTKDSWWKE